MDVQRQSKSTIWCNVMTKEKINGFSLMEVLIAIAVMSFLMILIYQISSSSFETAESVMTEDAEFMQIETAMSVIEKDISTLYTPLITEVKLQQKEDAETQIVMPNEYYTGITKSGKLIPKIVHEDKHTLAFMTFGNKRRLQDQKQSKFAWVRYSLESQTEDSDVKRADYKLTRQYTNQNFLDSEFEPKDAKVQTLIKNVKSMQFTFWHPKDQKYVDDLDKLPKEQPYPKLIKISMVIIDVTNNELEINRSVRVVWPYFDSSKENVPKESTKKADENLF